MAENIQQPTEDYEQQIFNKYMAEQGYYGLQIDLPLPHPASEWPTTLETDPELQRLAQEKEDNLNALVADEEAPATSERIYDARDYQRRPQTGREITQLMMRRRIELRDKDSQEEP